MLHICPICHTTIDVQTSEQEEQMKFLPFCSERCKLIDLGSWLDADYKILSPQKSRESDQDFDITESDSEV